MTPAGPFEVRFADSARDDLLRLFDFLLDRAATVQDLDRARRAVDSIEETVARQLARTPFSFRKAGTGSLRRELIVPFGHSGYVVLYEIEPGQQRVIVVAIRHQLEDDYH
jgi:plasmid stabilization system protein ParE